MPKELVTQEAVHSAAYALKADAWPVTVRAVRDRLGGGSLRDIMIHLRTWREKDLRNCIAEGPVPNAIREQQMKAAIAGITALIREQSGAPDDASCPNRHRGSPSHPRWATGRRRRHD